MTRTTISLPEDLHDRLCKMAAERHVSMATVIREALEEKARTHRPRPRVFAMGYSGHTDTARRAADELPQPPAWRS